MKIVSWFRCTSAALLVFAGCGIEDAPGERAASHPDGSGQTTGTAGTPTTGTAGTPTTGTGSAQTSGTGGGSGTGGSSAGGSAGRIADASVVARDADSSTGSAG